MPDGEEMLRSIEDDEDESDDVSDSNPERSIEHDLGSATDEDDFLAVMEENEDEVAKVRETGERIIGDHELDNVMRLNVADINTAENSHNYALTIEHPIEDNFTIFVQKPGVGDDLEDSDFAKLQEWYNIGDNIFLLQENSRGITLQKDHEKSEQSHNHGWRLVPPKQYEPPSPSIRERIVGGLSRIKYHINRPASSMVRMYGFLLTGAIAGPLTAFAVSASIFGAAGALGVTAISSIVFLFATVIGMVILEP